MLRLASEKCVSGETVAGLIDRIGSLAGTELGKALDLAHRFYQERMGVHSHTGRALIETVAEVARNHPNLVGIGVGLLVEKLLADQKRRHDVHIAELEGKAEAGLGHGAHPGPVAPKPALPHHAPHAPLVHHDLINLHALRPGRIAFEVFGALVLLKLASSGIRLFRHDKQHEVWFAPAARIRLWSGTIAAYYMVKSLKSPKVSAWRNAAIALFATDALKPVLRGPKRKGKNNQRSPAPAAPGPQPYVAPSPQPFPEARAAPALYYSEPSNATYEPPPPRPQPDANALH